MGFSAPASGVAGPTAADIGTAVGSAVPSAAAIGTAVNPPPTGAIVYGDGHDGAVTITANTTLAQDMFYTTLVVNAGITLTTAGWKIRCSVSLTNNGTIQNGGINAVDNNATTLGGAAGSLGGGGKGAAYLQVGGQPNPTTASVMGGSGADGIAGGGAGAKVAQTGTALLVLLTVGTISGATLTGGGGGGGGTSYGSGGGTGAGGCIALFCRQITNNAVIHVKGGLCYGGGGGGGGGVILIVSAAARAGFVPVVAGGINTSDSARNGNPGNLIELII